MRRALRFITLTLLLACPFAAVPAAASDLAKRIESIINAPEFQHAHWGLLVVDMESGNALYDARPTGYSRRRRQPSYFPWRRRSTNWAPITASKRPSTRTGTSIATVGCMATWCSSPAAT